MQVQKKLARCNQGHYYDSDKYSACPHCNKVAATPATSALPGGAAQAPMGVDSSAMKTQPAPGMGAAAPQAPMGGNTMPLTPPGQTNTMPIPNAVPSASANTMPLTPPAAAQTSSNVETGGQTIAMFPSAFKKPPVAGWLVAIDGPHTGDDFKIVAGKNFIGRYASMDISLEKDNAVSRDKHAAVIFDAEHNIFVLQEGESGKLTYLNDELVLPSKQLKANDKIKVGQSTLLFIPLCGESFKWEDYIKED